MPGERVAVLVVKKTASSTATRSTTRLGRQVRAEPHPRHRRSNVSSPAATNGLEKSGARWRIRTIQKYFRGAIRSRISSVHSTSLQGQRVSPRHRGVRAPPPPPVCKRVCACGLYCYIGPMLKSVTYKKRRMPVARASASAAGRWSLQGQCRCPNGTAISIDD